MQKFGLKNSTKFWLLILLFITGLFFWFFTKLMLLLVVIVLIVFLIIFLINATFDLLINFDKLITHFNKWLDNEN